jgi:hypothetical protein
MQIINKTNKEYKLHDPRTGEPTIIFRDARKIYFTKSAVERFGLVEGKRVHFIADLDRLYFFVNTDNAGFRLVSETRDTLKIHSMGLISTLRSQFPEKITGGVAFKLKALSTKINDCSAIEVLLRTRRVTASKKAKVSLTK